MPKRPRPRRVRTSAPAIPRSFVFRKLRLEPLEGRRMLAVGVVETADQAVELLGASPGLFVENQGQWADESVRYAFFGDGANVLHTDTGPVIQLFQSAVGGDSDGDLDLSFQSPTESPPTDDPDPIETATVSVSFIGADAINPVGQDRTETIHNYFIGDQSRWRSEVPTFETVAYPDLYDGIDLFTWGRPSSLKYEFHVAPGVDYRQIEVHYDGIDGLWIDDAGALHVDTPLGELVDDAPFIYQEIDGQQVEVPGEFQLIDDDTYTFSLAGDYDETVELVIDPILDWSTYVGGSGSDDGVGIAVDSEGNVLITGTSESTDFVFGGFDTTLGGERDAFVTKFSPSGVRLWSTFLGGDNNDSGNDIAVDSFGNVLVVGQTRLSTWVTGGFDTRPTVVRGTPLRPSSARRATTFGARSSAVMTPTLALALPWTPTEMLW